MSEHLRAAREKLQSAVQDIDREIAQLEGQIAQLRTYRQHLVDVLDGDRSAESSAAAPTLAIPPAKPTPAPPTSSPAAPPRETGVTNVDAANRIVAFLEKHGPSAPGAVFEGAKLPNTYASKKLLLDLAAAKRIVRTGNGRAARVSLLGQKLSPSSADAEGD